MLHTSYLPKLGPANEEVTISSSSLKKYIFMINIKPVDSFQLIF